MYPNIKQCLFPEDDSANPQETAEGSHAQPVSSQQLPVVSAENISARAVASTGNGSIQPSTSDLDLGDLGNQLAAAIRKGDLQALDNLLNLLEKRGIAPNLCDQQGHYPLYWVSDNFRASIILRTLLDRGVDPNISTIDPYNNKEYIPLLQASSNGSYEVSKALLEHGADPQARDSLNYTALHLATWAGDRQIIMLLKCLLDYGADINARNDPGRTPLCNAIIRGELSAVNVLLDAGADPNIPDNHGFTALDYAVSRGNTSMVDDLLAHGATPDTSGDKLDEIGWSNALYEALRGQRTGIVDMLLAYGANPNKVSIKGDPPLHMAIEKSNSTFVDMLLAHGANPNIRNPSGQTALEVAVVAGSPPRIIDTLREPFKPMPLKICARNCIRATLMRPQMTLKKTRAKPLSIKSQRLSLSDPLTKFVSNPLAVNETYSNIRQCLSRDDTANSKATAEGWHAQPLPSLQQPVASEGNISARAVASPGNGNIHSSTSDLDLGDLGDQLAVAIRNGRKGDLSALYDLLNLLEEQGINPNLCDQQGRYPLFWFRDSYRVHKCLKTLLYRGIDPNVSTIDPLTNEEFIPLLLAAKKGSYDVCKALLDHGADPQVHDLANWTALHWAGSAPDYQTVMLLKCLLDHGADINARNSMGHTPLCNAVIDGVFSLLTVNTLLGEGADANIPDNDGSTALGHAVFNGRTNMVDDLLAHGANPNKASKKGETPLHLAIKKSNSTCVDMLLAHGANPDIRNQSGQTALEAALATGAPVHIIDALREPFKPGATKVCARNCIRATRVQPQMTPKKNRAKPLSVVTQRLPLPNTLKKFVFNPLTF
ncbi:ankyrin repeat domain-containing protein [Salinisphaera sp. G21_0]|uniref:ankyrin repeat domain-containing protein n=1 Tax=Salinisphaera sp. G21_0 TaxID=2821094 RepID=UPI001ADAAB1A|nr:ankyrin repeat domain-containing protein [Salinisphaera sp. G21_0]MBO9482521.1 ankyrin repeat domain-containing protein [Salinisphaera sp. G21_0]